MRGALHSLPQGKVLTVQLILDSQGKEELAHHPQLGTHRVDLGYWDYVGLLSLGLREDRRHATP